MNDDVTMTSINGDATCNDAKQKGRKTCARRGKWHESVQFQIFIASALIKNDEKC